MDAKEYLAKEGIFMLDTRKRYKEVLKWMEGYALQFRSESGGSVSCEAHRPDIDELKKEWDVQVESEHNYMLTHGKCGFLFDRWEWVEKKFREFGALMNASANGAVADIPEKLLETIKSLDERERIVISLLYTQNLTIREIAKVFDWTINNTHKMLETILNKLKVATTSL